MKQFWLLVRQAIAGGDHDFTSGPIGRSVLLLAIPMMLEMFMESIFAVVDIFFVARLGADAVAAVGLTEAVITLVYALAIGLSMSTTAMVARRVGAKNPEGAAVVSGQALWVGFVVALGVGVIGILFARDILVLIGASTTVVEDGSGYTAIMLGGSLTILFLFLLGAIFRGAGDANIAMRALWLANGINIVLDPCLIFGLGPFPEMGVTGAAIATNIGRGIGVCYGLHCLFGRAGRIPMDISHLRIVPSVLARLLRVSVGGVLQFLIATSSWVVLMKIVSVYGSTAIAGYTIAIRTIDLTILPAWGMSNAAATLVGQNLGAGDPDRAERSVWVTVRYNAAFMISVAVVLIIFAEPILRLFIEDPTVVEYGVDCLRFVSYGYGFYAVGMVLEQSFNGAGDTVTPTWINLFCFWIVQIPLAYSLAQKLQLGPQGVFLAITVAESLIALVAVWLFRRGRWKLKAV
ncbi:MAG: MATE family efflux transporter [Gammaproteobacteria bacterium]|nr:MATE family efflux transporter [Gammaproteobacteria bacterium]